MTLKGKRVAILAENMYQEMELWVPYYRLKEEGAEVKVDAHLHESTWQIKDKDTIDQSSTVFANGKANPELRSTRHRASN